ncbi:MAG: response regulator [Acetobacteraceae bacterium]|jgi:two-component system response regulator RegA|nr:response regulator [Acetobacteraceae bacterium]
MTRPRVLVLDDNPAFVRTMEMMAAQSGLAMSATDDPDRFTDLLDGEDVAAAIVDCMLGDRNGLSILSEIGTKRPDLPTLVVSGFGDGFLCQAEQIGRSHGLTQLSTLAKPFGIADLRGFLANARTDRAA